MMKIYSIACTNKDNDNDENTTNSFATTTTTSIDNNDNKNEDDTAEGEHDGDVAAAATPAAAAAAAVAIAATDANDDDDDVQWFFIIKKVSLKRGWNFLKRLGSDIAPFSSGAIRTSFDSYDRVLVVQERLKYVMANNTFQWQHTSENGAE